MGFSFVQKGRVQESSNSNASCYQRYKEYQNTYNVLYVSFSFCYLMAIYTELFWWDLWRLFHFIESWVYFLCLKIMVELFGRCRKIAFWIFYSIPVFNFFSFDNWSLHFNYFIEKTEILISDRHKKQRAKNYAVLIILVAMVALFYFISLIRLGT